MDGRNLLTTTTFKGLPLSRLRSIGPPSLASCLSPPLSSSLPLTGIFLKVNTGVQYQVAVEPFASRTFRVVQSVCAASKTRRDLMRAQQTRLIGSLPRAAMAAQVSYHVKSRKIYMLYTVRCMQMKRIRDCLTSSFIHRDFLFIIVRVLSAHACSLYLCSFVILTYSEISN